MGTILKTVNLNKTFGRLQALDHVDLEVKRKDVVGIIGPNGAGKTTLFNVITGFLRASGGSIFFQDEDITNFSPYRLVRKGLSRTFQIPKPFRSLSVETNLTITVSADRKKDVIREEKIREILGLTGLRSKKDELAGNLPLGLLKCLEVARALSTLPSLILLDEPFAGLNAIEIEKISHIIRNLNSQEELTVIVIEHKLRELMKLVNQIVVLHHGEVIAQGTPREISGDRGVLKAYIGERTARVLQGMN